MLQSHGAAGKLDVHPDGSYMEHASKGYKISRIMLGLRTLFAAKVSI